MSESDHECAEGECGEGEGGRELLRLLVSIRIKKKIVVCINDYTYHL